MRHIATSLIAASLLLACGKEDAATGSSPSSAPASPSSSAASTAPATAVTSTAAGAAAGSSATASSAPAAADSASPDAAAVGDAYTTVEKEDAAGNAKANALGNSCYRLYRKREFKEAREACLEGLTYPGKSVFVHGALFYNLGLIAETTGNNAVAASYFRKSLIVRPTGTPADKVREALARVGG